MRQNIKYWTTVLVIFFVGCGSVDKNYEMGTYGYDRNFFVKCGLEVVELTESVDGAKILVIPSYQGRVMTSTAAGDAGNSYGWVNYKLIESGVIDPQHNPYGGEERFWLGPEGGPNSYYFKQGDEQIYANWKVPAAIDTESYVVKSVSNHSVSFEKQLCLTNARGNMFAIGVERTVELVARTEVEKVLGVVLPSTVKSVAFSSNNVLTNCGDYPWTRQTGMPSVWLLGMFNPTKTTTVFIPYNQNFDGRIVNDEYFGKIPSERLIVDNGMLYFKIDGEYRSKLGLPMESAKDLCGSYDSAKGVLTIIKYTLPETQAVYVNGQWGEQSDPFAGDVINSYNDGPTDTGTIMGPFFEVETSSPGAALAPGQKLVHKQYTMHLQGNPAQIAAIAETVFGIDLDVVISRFQ
ncbi:MAG: DUF6786 family protein [Alistipes sp.]